MLSVAVLFIQEYEKKFVSPAMFKEVYSRIQVMLISFVEVIFNR